MSESKIKLYYWGVKARAMLPVLICEAGGLDYEWERNPQWPALKPATPFGQLPFLEHGHIKLGQSMAIARYLARLAGLQGDTNEDFAMSEQLIEEQNDIYNVLAKANYSPGDKTEAWNTAFNTTLPAHFEKLEKLLKDDGEFFGSKMTTGDLAIFGITNILLDLEPSLLAAFPKVSAFYNRLAAHPRLARWQENPVPAYFKRQ